MRLNYEKFLSWPLSFFASFAGRLIKLLAFFFFIIIVVDVVFVVAVVVAVAFLMKKFLTLFLLFLILWFGFVRFIFWRSCAVFSGFLLALHTHTHTHYYESSVDVENKRWHVVDYQYSLAVSNSDSLCMCVFTIFYRLKACLRFINKVFATPYRMTHKRQTTKHKNAWWYKNSLSLALSQTITTSKLLEQIQIQFNGGLHYFI